MGLNLAEKLIAHAAGKDAVRPGETVTASVDLAMMHDSSGPRRFMPILERVGAEVWDRDKIVLVSDHWVPAVDPQIAEILDITRRWARENNIKAFYDMVGICHVVLPQGGHLKPGMFVVGGDSHSITGEAFGCYMFGVGATDMAGVLVTGETWIRVPETIRLEWNGKLKPGICAKDVNLALCAHLGLGGAEYRTVEYTGSLIGELNMEERMTLSNMAAELGAQAGLIAPDKTTCDWIKATGSDPGDAAPWQSDDDAEYYATHTFDADELEPQVAAPHSPANAAPASEHKGVNIDQAYIGACAGFGGGILAEEEVCISTTSRNFQGRMGAQSAKVYLGSPYAVAAAAVAGEICDPREFLQEA
jgi:3-isopropylmalate/(R)-2-methylmalate dehydratase large subunit